MSGRFCGNCGHENPEGARFCPNCGAPSAASGSASVPPAGAPSAPAPVPPPGPVAAPVPPPGPVAAPVGQPAGPTAGQPAAPWGGQPAGGNPFAGESPFGAARGGRGPLDRLLAGDWGGAASAAGAALAAMTLLALVAGLLLQVSEVGGRELLSFVLVAVAAALGGNLTVTANETEFGEGGGTSALGVLPLTLTFVGLTVLAVLFLRRLRVRGTTGALDVWLQVLRTALVLAGMTLVVALLSRYKVSDDVDEFDDLILFPGVTAAAGFLSSVFGALLFAVAALGLAVLLARPDVLPPRLQRLQQQLLPSFLAATLVFLGIGLLAALAGLVYSLATGDGAAVQAGAGLLLLPNLAISAVLLAMGVPLEAQGSAFGSGGEQSVNLFTFTDESAWFWLAPVLLAAALIAAAVTVVVRQHTVLDGRREGFRFAGMLALTAFSASLLARVAGEVLGFADEDFQGELSIVFNPVLAAFAAGLWGVLAGLLAPAVAGVLPSGTVAALRARAGTAPVQPPPQGPVGQPPATPAATPHVQPPAAGPYGPAPAGGPYDRPPASPPAG